MTRQVRAQRAFHRSRTACSRGPTASADMKSIVVVPEFNAATRRCCRPRSVPDSPASAGLDIYARAALKSWEPNTMQSMANSQRSQMKTPAHGATVRGMVKVDIAALSLTVPTRASAAPQPHSDPERFSQKTPFREWIDAGSEPGRVSSASEARGPSLQTGLIELACLC